MKNGKMRLCVIVINYKTARLVIDCLESLLNQLDRHRDHMVVVDNCSNGSDVFQLNEYVRENGLNGLVKIIASASNDGFSAGNNIGISAVGAQFYLLANGDTLFRKDAISELLKAVDEYPEAGIISPRLEWPDGVPQISCFRFPSPFSELINSAGTGVITKILDNYNVPLDVSDQITWPNWTSFACVLIRREVFDSIGYLDEGYFMYYEDCDFCRRAKNAGFSLLNYPTSHVIHLRGQSSGLKETQKELNRLPTYYYRSRARYFTKFYGRVGCWFTNVCWYVGWSVCLMRELLLGRKRTLPRYQFIDIWKQ